MFFILNKLSHMKTKIKFPWWLDQKHDVIYVVQSYAMIYCWSTSEHMITNWFINYMHQIAKEIS